MVSLLRCMVSAALLCYKVGECSFTVLGDECRFIVFTVWLVRLYC